jgi:hypothetical protein
VRRRLDKPSDFALRTANGYRSSKTDGAAGGMLVVRHFSFAAALVHLSTDLP